MGDRTKRIFISDIHMGDARSMTGTHPYGWFNKNVKTLAKFLDEQLHAPDVKEVVILGDLFDQWIIPSTDTPLASFDDIYSNEANQPVIEGLKALAASGEIKLAYVPGNHDMAMTADKIAKTKEFMDDKFPGIRFFCDSRTPWGVYSVGTIAAEHGNRYCLFNAPDPLDHPGDFLPLGYFISRLVAYKASTKGQQEDSINILRNIIEDTMHSSNLVYDVLLAIAKDAGLDGGSRIELKGTGYPEEMTVDEVGQLFQRLPHNWEQTPGNVNIVSAIMGDRGNLLYAADSTYLRYGSHINVVIFGHTHVPTMCKSYYEDVKSDNAPDLKGIACRNIYANSGTWVDLASKGCTYVETEEVPDERRLYVRVMEYPDKTVIDDFEGFVEI